MVDNTIVRLVLILLEIVAISPILLVAWQTHILLVLGNHFAWFLDNSSGEWSHDPSRFLWVETANAGESDGILSASIHTGP